MRGSRFAACYARRWRLCPGASTPTPAQDRANIAAGATPAHAVGTDDLGRDRGERVAVAFLVALAGAVAASLLATAIAAAVGAGAAFLPRVLGHALLYASDLMLTLPWIFLLMIVRSALPLNLHAGISAVVTFAMLAVLGWPAFARIHYARCVAVRDAGWMQHTRASGLRHWQIARAHVLPHLRPLLLVQFLLYVPICITAEANLGTLGLGISEPLPSWGSMLLSLKSTSVLSSTHWVFLPLVLLIVVLLALELTVFQEER